MSKTKAVYMEEKKINNRNILDEVFLSYDKILYKLKAQGIKTKHNQEIAHNDLRKAIYVMQQKHKNCRWKSEKIISRKSYILIEGYYWLKSVYFQNEKSQIDADIEFFLLRIKQYEKLLKLKSKELFNEDVYVKDLEKYFNREKRTIEKAIVKMQKSTGEKYKYLKNGEYVLNFKGIEWLCKNCFKQKYLEILEQYKMELTELYIQAGYPYDNFFGKN